MWPLVSAAMLVYTEAEFKEHVSKKNTWSKKLLKKAMLPNGTAVVADEGIQGA